MEKAFEVLGGVAPVCELEDADAALGGASQLLEQDDHFDFERRRGGCPAPLQDGRNA